MCCPQESGGVRRGDSPLFSTGLPASALWEVVTPLGQDSFSYWRFLWKLKDTARSDAVGQALHILLDRWNLRLQFWNGFMKYWIIFIIGGEKVNGLIFHQNEGQEKSEAGCLSELWWWCIIYYCPCYMWLINLSYSYSDKKRYSK